MGDGDTRRLECTVVNKTGGQAIKSIVCIDRLH